MRTTTVLLVAAILHGCGDSLRTADDGFRTEVDENGLTWAVNSGDGAWTAEEQWVATEALRIGAAAGEGPELFGDLGAIAADPDGNVYVLEYQVQELRVFDGSGNHVRTFGRRGEGPGEWVGAAGLTFAPDGSLWVWDPNGGRFSSFSTTGELLAEGPRGILGVLFPWPGGFDHREGLLDFGLDRPGSQGNQLGSLQVVHPIVVDPVAGTVDTLPSLEKEYRVIGGSTYAPLGGFITTAMDHDGALWFAHTERYEIFKRDLRGGDTLFATRRADVELEPVTTAIQDSILALYAEGPAGFPVPERSDFPPTFPVIKRMLTDDAGHLLVFVDAAGEESGTQIDVFDESDGRFLGSVTLPVHLLTNPRPVATPGRLYGVITDDLGVPYVVRIDLEPGGTN